MGQEITSSSFSQSDFDEFSRRLQQETDLLRQMLSDNAFDQSEPVAGYELEAWLTDSQGRPSPSNDRFLEMLGDPEVVAELALFNIELNGPPRKLTGHVLSQMQADLEARWESCVETAREMGLNLVAIGTLPTVRRDDLCLENMSQLKRYQALNNQVLRLREGRPIELDIEGRDSLKLQHEDVMMEAATTSFQLHMKIDARQATRYYNLSKIISAPMVAISTNSPFLFGKQLWEETRIPLFEQAVSVGGSDYSRRVTFGVRYASGGIHEVFDANCRRYPVLLPTVSDTPPEEFAHLRLHNGTLWRWTRPLIGFSANGKPHIRIEHRSVAAGPTHADEIANAAFFFGLITALMQNDNIEQRIPHIVSRHNFYAAAKSGMDASVEWLDAKETSLRTLVLQELLPLARKGLVSLDVDHDEADASLHIIRERLQSRQTGARWQREWVAKHGSDWRGLVLEYSEHQASGKPVHTWSV
jgi:gamma-glutamyl:cysteine ligase YbdK (ATP-grasp superfamily)